MEMLYDPKHKQGPLTRTIKEVKLMEAGPVVFPAYPQTSVGVRSLTDEQRESLVEEYTRTSIEDLEDESVGPDAVSDESEDVREEASSTETPSEESDTSQGYNQSVRARKLALKFKNKE
jgi:hypothetical protein